MDTTKTNVIQKPEISADAKERIMRMVRAIEHFQRAYKVEIAAEDDMICFRDTTRSEDDWIDPVGDGDVYGVWDAWIGGAELYGTFRCENVEFEDFDGWGK